MTPVDPANTTSNGWNEWSRHVLAELKRLSTAVENLEQGRLADREDIGKLIVKSGLTGLLGGVIPALGVLIYFLVK